MKKIKVYTKEHGVKTLKAEVTLDQYRAKYPNAIKVRVPCMKKLEEWSSDCGCEAIDGCWVEPDGECDHGYQSWLMELGYI
uniref:Uncharacterized protein n=1 Tax=viral metagenome TaxID=1070528 RepID=A0A6M3LE62_9ZZZZ